MAETQSYTYRIQGNKWRSIIIPVRIKNVPVYCIDLSLPNGSVFKQLKVSEFHKAYDFDFIIGMNILRQGNMAITTANNETGFSFRIPAGTRHIDFMSEQV